MNASGYVLIPEDIRLRHHFTPETKFSIDETGERIVLKPLSKTALEKAVGFLGTEGKALDFVMAERAKDREPQGFRHGAKLKIAEEGKKNVIPSETKTIIDPKVVDKATAHAALERAVGFMGTDGRALKMLMEERRREAGL